MVALQLHSWYPTISTRADGHDAAAAGLGVPHGVVLHGKLSTATTDAFTAYEMGTRLSPSTFTLRGSDQVIELVGPVDAQRAERAGVSPFLPLALSG